MILKARHHWFYYPFFQWYSRVMPKMDFREVHFHGKPEDKGLPILMIGNHFSWWDGFFALNINQVYFKRKFHIMMLEEQLKQRMMLNKTGAFSIKKGSRSMLESLNYAEELLSEPGNMLVLFPQGSFQSIYDRPLVFEKGWFRIIEKASQPVQVVFFHALIDYFSHRKPSLHFYLYTHDYHNDDHASFENAFNRYYIESIEKQKSLK